MRWKSRTECFLLGCELQGFCAGGVDLGLCVGGAFGGVRIDLVKGWEGDTDHCSWRLWARRGWSPCLRST